MERTVTIIADASFCPDTKAAGYGCYVAGARGKQAFSGKLVSAKSCNSAEAMAIANAIWHGFDNKLIVPGCILLIQTDSQNTIRMYRGTKMPDDIEQHNALNYVNHLKEKYNLQITFKHVPGHTNGVAARIRSQAHCDSAAYKQMSKLREKRKSGDNKRKNRFLRRGVN